MVYNVASEKFQFQKFFLSFANDYYANIVNEAHS